MNNKTNILFLLADDYGAWAMGCAGNEEIKTPNLDRLAREGTRLENCFCVSPVCSPARASIFTGEIPSQHGVHDWLAKGHLDSELALSDELKAGIEDENSPWYYKWPRSQLKGDHAIRYLDGHKTFTQRLYESGYECAISGKWHMGDSFHPQAGFTYWKTTAMGGDNYFYPVMMENGKMCLQKDRYVTDLIADNAIDFLRQQNRTQPFYLSVHFTAPHSPWSAENHPKRYIDMYKDCPFTSTPNVPPHPWAPNCNKTLEQWNSEPHSGIRFSGAHYGPIPETWQEHRRESLTGYYAAVSAMDAAIGRILDTLDADGRRDSTLVIFTGDNGMSMGHHGIWGKGNGTNPVNMYDSAVKVPALFRLPGSVLTNTVVRQIVSHYDFYQTILDFAGVETAADAKRPGVSIKPILTGERASVRESVVAFDEYGPCRMIRTYKDKLVLRYPSGPNEYYDLRGDREECNNLFDSPEHQARIAELSKELAAWFEEYVDTRFDGSLEPVHGSGQLTSHAFL